MLQSGTASRGDRQPKVALSPVMSQLECDMAATQTQQKCFEIVTCTTKGPHPPIVHPIDSSLVLGYISSSGLESHSSENILTYLVM